MRQSFALYTGDPSNPVALDNVSPLMTPRYDVVERVVTYTLPPGVLLRPNTHYTAEIIPAEGDSGFGFRAFDGAALDPETTLRASFLTSNREESSVIETVPTCSELVHGRLSTTPGEQRPSTFVSCNTGGCHGSDGGRMDLDLSSERAVSITAVGRVAHQTETTPSTGVDLQNSPRFGAAMPRVDPGRPSNSYLLYKLVTAPENYGGAADADPCATSYPELAVDPELCVAPNADEIDRMRAWFLRGLPMPRSPSTELEPRWLSREQLRGIQAWIFAGAGCP